MGSWIFGRTEMKDVPLFGGKTWWKSKTIWGAIVTAVVSAYMVVQPVFGWPVIPDWLFAVLEGLGLTVVINGRLTASKRIVT
jgi:hypothetical protein